MDSISIMHKLKGLPLSLFFGPESVIMNLWWLIIYAMEPYGDINKALVTPISI